MRVALQRIAAAAATLHRSKSYRAAVTLAVARRAGLLAEWRDVTFPVPAGFGFSRPDQARTYAQVLGGRADRVFNLSTAAGQAAHQVIGRPTDVVIDALGGFGPGGRIRVGAVAGYSTDRPYGVLLPLDAEAFSWGRAPHGGVVTRAEFQLSNDLTQQQGLHCAYPLGELRSMGPVRAAAEIAASRRNCAYIGREQLPSGGFKPVCRLNGTNCEYKSGATGYGQTAWGKGGPKVLLEDGSRPRHLAAAVQPGAAPPIVRVPIARGRPQHVLAPNWLPLVRAWSRGDRANANFPTARDVATVRGWLDGVGANGTARLRTVADLVGEATMLELFD